MKKRTQKPRLHRHVRHLLIPHKGNHFRPHLVRLHGITAVLVLIVLMQAIYGFATTGTFSILGRVTTIDTAQLLDETNSARQQQGLLGLRVNEDLNEAAALKAQDMFANNYWAHNSPSGVSPWKWLADVGYTYTIAGENLAKNYPNASATVGAWLESPSHRENMLNDRYTEVGFAVVEGVLEDRQTTLVVAYYGAPRIIAVEGTSDTVAPEVVAAPLNENLNIFSYFGTALQSLTPATLGAIAMLTVVAFVAGMAHHYRQKLPASWRKTWRVHHGAFTLVGMVGLAFIMVFATGGGQI